jgi:hypothetical protein
VSRIRIRKLLYWHKQLKGRENLTKITFCVGPVRPIDKENQV